jgi:SlyX protein
MTTDAQRIEALEMQVAHQEQAIAELNDVITRQWKKISELDRLLKNLLEDVQNIAPGREGPEPPPPHY